MRESNLLKGSAYVLTAFFCMAIFGELTKVATQHATNIWVSFITYLTATMMMSLYVLSQGLQVLKTSRFSYHFGRAAFGVSASFLYTLAMLNIPLVNATLLFNTAPIFIPILATIWLKAKVSQRTWWAVFLGFIGIIIIIKPDANMLAQPGDLLGLASGISLAIAYLLIKLLTPTDSSTRIIFYFFFISTLLQIPFLYFFGGSMPELQGVLISCCAGMALLGAQVFLVEGYRYAEASQLGIYQYASVVFVGIFDWILKDIVPSISEVFGACIVAVAALIIIRSGVSLGKEVKGSAKINH